jgi:hypothetical protein
MEAFARNKELYGENAAKFTNKVARAHMLMELMLKHMPQKPRATESGIALITLCAMLTEFVMCIYEIHGDDMATYVMLAQDLSREIMAEIE